MRSIPPPQGEGGRREAATGWGHSHPLKVHPTRVPPTLILPRKRGRERRG
jgi:hypothetical protein